WRFGRFPIPFENLLGCLVCFGLAFVLFRCTLRSRLARGCLLLARGSFFQGLIVRAPIPRHRSLSWFRRRFGWRLVLLLGRFPLPSCAVMLVLSGLGWCFERLYSLVGEADSGLFGIVVANLRSGFVIVGCVQQVQRGDG